MLLLELAMKFTNALGGCANCGALTSPCWRKGPEEARHLCNACGSRYLVKGTLEGYKPGQKSRAGSKRGKKGKSYSSKYDSYQSADHPRKRSRFADKAVQVDPLELQGMQPFPQLFTATGGSGNYLTASCSPTSPLDRMQTEDASDASLGEPKGEALPEVKACSDESSPDRDGANASPDNITRRRARKPFKPTSSTW